MSIAVVLCLRSARLGGSSPTLSLARILERGKYLGNSYTITPRPRPRLSTCYFIALVNLMCTLRYIKWPDCPHAAWSHIVPCSLVRDGKYCDTSRTGKPVKFQRISVRNTVDWGSKTSGGDQLGRLCFPDGTLVDRKVSQCDLCRWGRPPMSRAHSNGGEREVLSGNHVAAGSGESGDNGSFGCFGGVRSWFGRPK